MRLKVFVVDFEVPARAKRWALTLGLPALVLSVAAVALAGPVSFTDGQTLKAADLNANFGYLVPSGTMVAFAGTTPPNGWLRCDGSPVPTTQYPDLFAAIGTAWGAPDATHFNLPDVRGRFVRGTDRGAGRDPDANSRTSSNPGGNTGSAVGTVEGHAFASHDHGGQTGELVNATGGWNLYVNYGGAGPSGPAIANMTQSNVSNYLWQHTHTIAAQGGSETRPVNVDVEWIIKY
jgi:hypothetical protein